MNLIEKPEPVIFPATHLAFIERQGPFMSTAPKAWQDLHALRPQLAAHNEIIGWLALYKPDARQLYRACAMLKAPAKNLPPEVAGDRFAGGKYICFVLTGSYAQLPQACGQVFEQVGARKLPRRDDWCIEHYVNDPNVTPEAELVTHILGPIA
jgi:DNA gyrase inhibitor GyrI